MLDRDICTLIQCDYSDFFGGVDDMFFPFFGLVRTFLVWCIRRNNGKTKNITKILFWCLFLVQIFWCHFDVIKLVGDSRHSLWFCRLLSRYYTHRLFILLFFLKMDGCFFFEHFKNLFLRLLGINSLCFLILYCLTKKWYCKKT